MGRPKLPRVTGYCKTCNKEVQRIKEQKNYFCSQECSKVHWLSIGPWNKGKTKHDDSRLMDISKKSTEQMHKEYANGTRDKSTIAEVAHQTLRDRTQKKFDEGNLNRKISKRGYLMIYLPIIGWYREHTYIWEQHNKCKVPKGFHVHHKNGDRLDNIIDNLELISAREHAKHHYTERGIDKATGRFK